MKRKTDDSAPVEPVAVHEGLEALRRQIAQLSEKVGEMSRSEAVAKLTPDMRAAISILPERFPKNTIADRIASALKTYGVEIKQIAPVLGIGESAVYKKMQKVTPFTVREIDLIARALGAPSYWPFADWELALAIDHQLVGKPAR